MKRTKKSPVERMIQQTTSKVDKLLDTGYQLWKEFGFPKLELVDKHLVVSFAVELYHEKEYTTEFAAACQCFYLFRRLHTMIEEFPEQATLLGDYFFSQFSHYLIPIDNTQLIDAFAEFLEFDAKSQEEDQPFDLSNYLYFMKQIVKELEL